MKHPKVLFFCGHNSAYGKAHLEPILDSSLDVTAVVLADDHRWSLFRENLQGKNYTSSKPSSLYARIRDARKRKKRRTRSRRQTEAFEKLCAVRNIPIWWLHDVNDSNFTERISRSQIDWIISAAYPQIFGSQLLKIPAFGSINFHPSLLPQFRGAHPHFWVIATGASETGITAHFLTEDIDDGDIIAQIAFPIDSINYSALYERLLTETPKLVEQVIRFCQSSDKTATPQNAEAATYFRNDREIHHRLFWDELSAREIINLVRTETAFCFFRDEKVKILDAYATESNRNLTNNVKVSPGTIVDWCQNALVVKAVDGCVNIRQLTYNGRSHSFDRWATKLNAQIGERFL